MHNLAFLIRKIALLVFLLPAPVFALEDVILGMGSSGNSLSILNPGVDTGKLNCLLSRCLQLYSADFGGYLFAYDVDRHTIKFDNTTLYYTQGGSTVEGGFIQCEQVNIAPCIYTSASNLDTVGDCYIWLFVVARWRWARSPYTVNSACYRVSGFGQSLSYDQIEALTISRVTSPSDWIFPIYLNVTDQGNSNFSCYLTQNCPVSVNNISPVYNVQSQQAASALQLGQHWSSSWLLACTSNTGAGSVSNAWQIIKQRLDNNYIVYTDSNFSTVAWGGRPATSGVAGYIDLGYSLFSVLTDFDRGGQCDWSEYYRGQNMRLASDDAPNVDSINPDSIIVVEPDAAPGQSNLDAMFSTNVEDITTASLNDTKQEVQSRLESVIEANEGMASLRALINPAGFRTDRPLPHYTVHLNNNTRSGGFLGVNLNLPDIEIDFEFLREQPYRDIWLFVRSVLNFSLVTMTFLSCYGLYEKALAWSV